MTSPRRFASRLLLALAAVSLAACGGDAAETDAADTGAVSYSENAIVIRPVGNEMRYAQTEFTVEAGQEVELVFENIATSPVMQHNIVLLNTDDQAAVDRVGQAALAVGAAGAYVPDDPAVLASTSVSGPGETVSVTFTAPSEPGRYRYLCTYPGHYALMQGTMIVT
ncbi:MAG: plastocyanin/azurin family copper-binding protein [Bacteroidota bacterium]